MQLNTLGLVFVYAGLCLWIGLGISYMLSRSKHRK
jgi:hypothetical protein